jgi:membrane fusion protein, multidrug efflux system
VTWFNSLESRNNFIDVAIVNVPGVTVQHGCFSRITWLSSHGMFIGDGGLNNMNPKHRFHQQDSRIKFLPNAWQLPYRSFLSLIAIVVLLLVGCEKAVEVEDVRPVRIVTVEKKVNEEPITMSGQVEAHNYINAAFRTSGRIVERLVSVGDVVKAGQPLARLDPKIEKSAVEMAEAELAAVAALLQQTEINEKRESRLLKSNATSHSTYEEALRQFKSAQAQVQGAEARLRSAQEQLDFTVLKAEADGVVTERTAEVGEVVAAGQLVLRIAKNGLIDAVFDVPETLIRNGVKQGQVIEVCLNADKDICAEGIVYEIAPQSDSVTRTHLTKTQMKDTPARMLLGASVVGYLKLSATPSIHVPASSLTISNGQPAVWVVDPAQNIVRLNPITVGQYTANYVAIADGLTPGDMVVTAGVQTLHQNQKVKLLPEASADKQHAVENFVIGQ